MDDTLELKGFPGVWALGDCASVPDISNAGKFHPPTAQHALRQLFDRSFQHHLPIVEQPNPVTNCLHLIKQVGREQNGDTFLFQIMDHLQELVRGFWVQA